MKTVKDEVRELLDELPDDVSMESVIARLNFKASIRRGLEDIERGDVVAQEQVEEEHRRWRESFGHAKHAGS